MKCCQPSSTRWRRCAKVLRNCTTPILLIPFQGNTSGIFTMLHITSRRTKRYIMATLPRPCARPISLSKENTASPSFHMLCWSRMSALPTRWLRSFDRCKQYAGSLSYAPATGGGAPITYLAHPSRQTACRGWLWQQTRDGVGTSSRGTGVEYASTCAHRIQPAGGIHGRAVPSPDDYTHSQWRRTGWHIAGTIDALYRQRGGIWHAQFHRDTQYGP